MNEEKDIVSSAHSGNPFRTPEGYFDSLEDRLMARIATEQAEGTPRRPVWRVLRPALTLAAMFLLIFGMGYGVLSLTHTLDRGTGTTEVGSYASAEEELIRPASIITYYQTEGQAEEEELDEESLVDYLAVSVNFTDLAEFYAQSY